MPDLAVDSRVAVLELVRGGGIGVRIGRTVHGEVVCDRGQRRRSPTSPNEPEPTLRDVDNASSGPSLRRGSQPVGRDPERGDLGSHGGSMDSQDLCRPGEVTAGVIEHVAQ